ncbi:hypothetical protein J6590_079988 [Homalodisca vitripennis]|nr:hypothetical protein J6590_079988 [Homalodisca vitripennis]
MIRCCIANRTYYLNPRREEEEGYNSDNAVCYSQSFRHDSPCSSDSGCHQVELVFKRRYFRNAPKPYFSDSLRDTLGLAEVTNQEGCFKRICKAGHFLLAVKMITLGEDAICYDGEAFNRPELKATTFKLTSYGTNKESFWIESMLGDSQYGWWGPEESSVEF